MAESTVTIKTSGMHCRSCVMNVDLTLGDLTGVVASETDLESGRSVVTYDDAVVSVDDIVAAIKGAGYGAEPEA